MNTRPLSTHGGTPAAQKPSIGALSRNSDVGFISTSRYLTTKQHHAVFRFGAFEQNCRGAVWHELRHVCV